MTEAYSHNMQPDQEEEKLPENGGIKVFSKKGTITHQREVFWHSEESFSTATNYNETFKSAFEFSGIGMMIINPEGRILESNNAISNFTGYTRSELLKLNFLDLGHPEDNTTDKSLMQNMLTRVLNYYSLEKKYISKYNKILWGMHTVSKVLNKDGTLKYFVLQVVDITRRKELTDEVNRKNSELEAIRAGLIGKLNQVEELNRIIAHNLRGPASNIQLLVGMLKDKDGREKDTGLELSVNEIVDFLDDSSKSLTDSLETLMNVVQISMNKGIPMDDCDVRQIVNEILGQLNSTVFEKKAIIALNLKVEQVKYPKVFLESIFYNLISNALKYTCKDRRPEIIVSTYQAEGRVMLSVRDNGLGINLSKYGGKIFHLNQVFHPGHDSKGVGLFITKAQIESFGGSIEVRSTENVGSEFVVML